MALTYLRDLKRKLFMFGNIKRPIRPNKINVYYWKRNDNLDNVGDVLSKVVFNLTAESKGLNPDKRLVRTHRVLAIGSVISLADQNSTVWGSGLLHKDSVKDIKPVKLDFRAVRGPRTRTTLIEKGYKVPEVYGDPAILLPLYFNPYVEKKVDFKVIPHHYKFHEYASQYPEANLISTITSDWKGFVTSILEAKFIISASLHGVILAEAYGVPAILLNDIEGSLFKYEDYYQSTGRQTFKIASTVENALAQGPEVLPDLTKLQSLISSAFPVDLWK